MEKKYRLYILGCLILIISVIFFVQFLQHGCVWWGYIPLRNFQVSELSIPSDQLLQGSIVNEMVPLSDEHDTVEDGIQTIYWDNGNGILVYQVYRYSSENKANQYFDFLKDKLRNTESGEDWNSTDILKFDSSTASSVYIACGNWSEERCGMIAQYEEYVIFVNSTIDNRMTYSKFERIMLYIDSQISEKMYDGNLESGN